MKEFLALCLSIAVMIWAVIIPIGATVLVLLLFNASAGLSILILVTFGVPLTVASGAMSHKVADRIMDWAENHAS